MDLQKARQTAFGASTCEVFTKYQNRMSFAEPAAYKEDLRNECTILVGKPGG
jgi:hypothetical protein